jgi:predicted dehydrogenase
MIKVKIYGAGSIGNHLAYACRSKGWEVLICDCDTKALERTKEETYPSRYGEWDPAIRLVTVNKLASERCDLVIIGTPPDTHLPLALEVLKKESPRVVLIEKPLGTPSLDGCDELFKLAKAKNVFVTVGYNHSLTAHSLAAEKMLKTNVIGKPLTISAVFRENWSGIFKAHPWLSGPEDSYLGFFKRGGGAAGEHSHAINIWQHFAHLLGVGRITEVSAMLDMVEEGKVAYDRICQLHVKTEKGFVGEVVQDVITEPTQKNLRIQGDSGFLEWHVNYDSSHDALVLGTAKDIKNELFPKKRPDDFKGEIDHIETILKEKITQSPISLERGLETMLVIAAAYKSHQLKRTVSIFYDKGYSLQALQ